MYLLKKLLRCVSWFSLLPSLRLPPPISWYVSASLCDPSSMQAWKLDSNCYLYFHFTLNIENVQAWTNSLNLAPFLPTNSLKSGFSTGARDHILEQESNLLGKFICVFSPMSEQRFVLGIRVSSRPVWSLRLSDSSISWHLCGSDFLLDLLSGRTRNSRPVTCMLVLQHRYNRYLSIPARKQRCEMRLLERVCLRSATICKG